MFLYEVACCCLVEFAFFWNMLPIRFWDRAVQPTRCVHAAGERTTQHRLLGTDRHHLLCKNKTLLAHPFECTRRVFRSPYLCLVPFKGTKRPLWFSSCFSQLGEAFSDRHTPLIPRHPTASRRCGNRGWWLQPRFVPPCASLTPRHSTVSKALAADAVGGFNRLLCRHALLWRPWASWTPRRSRQTATVASGRYLPPYASWHGPLLFVPRRSRPHGWWPQPTCPHSLFIGAGFSWPHYTTF